MDNFNTHRNPVEQHPWMGWLYTIVGCCIVALLVLMFLDMSDKANLNRLPPEASPAVQISSHAIANPT